MTAYFFSAALLVSFAALSLLKNNSLLLRRLYPVLMGLLIFLAVAAHYRFFAFHGMGQNFHNLEVFHYYMGSKYFPEVGYTGLYEASVVADAMEDPYFKKDLPIRSLENYQFVSRQDILARKELIVSRFTPSRWQQFRADLAVFRSTAPTNWSSQFGYRDHGYNASPFLTWILSRVSALPWFSAETFIKTCGWLDPIVIFTAALGVCGLAGFEAALVFLFLTAMNPLNDYTMIGGSYLRYLSYSAAALGIAAWRRGKNILSGFFLAGASLMRIFPVFFALGFVGESILGKKDKAGRLKTGPFILGFLVTSAAVFFLTMTPSKSSNENPWLSFRRQIKIHAEELTPNKIGLRFLFSFSDRHNVQKVLSTWPQGKRLSWSAESEKTFLRRAPYYWLCLGILCTFSLFLVSRTGSAGVLGGMILVFAFLDLSHYYYCFLALVPLALEEKKNVLVFSSFLFAVIYLVQSIPGIGEVTDRRFFALSLLVLVHFLGVSFLLIQDRGLRSNSGRLRPDSSAVVSP